MRILDFNRLTNIVKYSMTTNICVIVCLFPPQIENLLYRNHESRKYQQEQAYRLQQGIVTTTTQQVCQHIICHIITDYLLSIFFSYCTLHKCNYVCNHSAATMYSSFHAELLIWALNCWFLFCR